MWFRTGNLVEVICVEQDKRLCPLGVVPFYIRVVVAHLQMFMAVLVIIFASLVITKEDANTDAISVILVFAILALPTSCCLCLVNPFSSVEYKRSRSHLRFYMVYSSIQLVIMIYLLHVIFSDLDDIPQLGGSYESFCYIVLVYFLILVFSLITAIRATAQLLRSLRRPGQVFHDSGYQNNLEEAESYPKEHNVQLAED